MSFWPMEHRSALRSYVEAGLSASMIADALSREFKRLFTRNSIISKVRREPGLLLMGGGLKSGPKPGTKPKRAPKATPAQRPDIAIRKAAGPQPPPDRYVPVPDPLPGNVTLLELAPGGCKWPSGDRQILFCNQPQYPGLPYCGCHAQLAYRER